MSTMWITYTLGDENYYESLKNQKAHAKRIIKWLNSGEEVVVNMYQLEPRRDKNFNSNYMIAVGLYENFIHPCDISYTSFDVKKINYKISDYFGRFSAIINGINVEATRKWHDFSISHMMRQIALFHLNCLLKNFNLEKNRQDRLAISPICKKKILPLYKQIEKMKSWGELHKSWNYPEKGAFPEIPVDILEQEKYFPKPEGYRPAVELNFYLSILEEHLHFVSEVLWRNELKKECRFWGDITELVLRKTPWPANQVKLVGIDIEAYMEEEGTSASGVGNMEKDPIHVESFNHLLMHKVEYPHYISIPGLCMSVEGHTMGPRILMGAEGVAIDSDLECLEGFIASRIF
jgi:hypothetical protein